MSETHKHRFFHGVRFKLLLVSLSLFAIPWAGYRYIEETEIFLRQAREQVLLDTAQSIATILHNREELFTADMDLPHEMPPESALYAHPLEAPIQLDGYDEDWRPYLSRARRHGVEQAQAPAQPSMKPDLSFESLLGIRGPYLYALLRVRDDRIVYQDPADDRVDYNDRLLIIMERPEGGIARYLVATPAPGWVHASVMPDGPTQAHGARPEVRIKGEWQEATDGYTVELRIPRSLIGKRLAFAVADVDDPHTGEPSTLVATSGIQDTDQPGRLITASPDIARIIGRLKHEDARIWVLDKHRRVLAQRGSLKKDPLRVEPDAAKTPDAGVLNALFRLVLRQPADDFADLFANASRLQGQEIDAALNNKPGTSHRLSPDRKAVILSAAYPIHGADGIIGTVLVEQTTNAILSLQNQALERLFSITLMAFAATSLVLLGFASLLTGRIRRLRDRLETAVTADGRIRTRLIPSGSKDEIGDLERSFSSVMNRLDEYNRYLEAMASRLAHEMRTPLTMVKSSLENLEMVTEQEDSRPYLRRAGKGVDRLAVILNQMREATRLEQALQHTNKDVFDLLEFFKAACENYRMIYPNIDFEVEATDKPVRVHGAPDLIVQALDKLVANAVDFHSQGSPIRFRLSLTDKGVAALGIVNQGPCLPEDMRRELFGSMVSLRPTGGDEPHLGLGLYLVQMISEYHGGKAVAENLPDTRGVAFSILLPTIGAQSPLYSGDKNGRP